MNPPARIGIIRSGRLTLGVCIALALGITVAGLGSLALVEVTPPDTAFSARVAVLLATAPPRARLR